MNDQEILQLLQKTIKSTSLTLTFKKPESYFYAYWDSNRWLAHNFADPLSILLVDLQIPKVDGDCLALSSLSKFFNKRIAWVESFQNGVYGLTNSNSISGFLLGRKLRQ